MSQKTSIYHSPEDNAFGCHGCFERIEIPRWVNDPFVFVAFREELEESHQERGCFEQMARLEAAGSHRKNGTHV